MYAEEQQAVVRDDAPALQDPVIKQMVVQLRAMDSYGTYDTWSDARVLDPLVLTRERRRAIPIVGDPDEVTLSRVKAFYNALAQMIERVRERIAATDEPDQVTQDLLIGITAELEKQHWMFQAQT